MGVCCLWISRAGAWCVVVPRLINALAAGLLRTHNDDRSRLKSIAR